MVIIKIRLGKATDTERAYLLEWLDEDGRNRGLYKDIIHGVSLRERIVLEDKINETTDFEEIKKIIIKKLRFGRVRRLSYRVAAAAAVLILCSTPFLIYNNPTVAEIFAAEDPTGKVQLILHTGQRIDIETNDVSIEELIANTSLSADVQITENGLPETTPMNRLVTFREGQSSFRLEDGTTVWLNAVSTLDFPTCFGSGERIVRLSGEAYFEVAHDPDRPFIVVTGEQSVRALGTSFNVQAYPDESEIYTTLVTGSVKVTRSGGGEDEGVILTPGMQSILDRSSDQVRTAQVNATDMAAWRNGEFIFNEKPIGNVTRMLSRWYDVEFIYPAERAGLHTFSGKINRIQSLQTILEMITMAGGPAFEKSGTKVYVIER